IFFLKEQRKETAFSEYVFVSNGHPLQTNMVNRKLKHICEQAGVGYLSSHKIRFWAVTAMYDSNLPDYVIQYTAGHADPATTNHYKRPEKLGKKIEPDTWNRMFG
ncbi:MAG: tyrosine-type recombinase/integrase, partial [Lachnospiraceae bacterium]|nr:tyrosine-type recombinase/integrase [Lachnospiraceae bacterium]